MPRYRRATTVRRTFRMSRHADRPLTELEREVLTAIVARFFTMPNEHVTHHVSRDPDERTAIWYQFQVYDQFPKKRRDVLMRVMASLCSKGYFHNSVRHRSRTFSWAHELPMRAFFSDAHESIVRLGG